MTKAKRMMAVGVATWMISSPGWAAESRGTTGPQINVLEGELEKALDEEGLKREGNFGRFHLFGYGELHYNNEIGSAKDLIDFHRMVLGVGYDFTDRIKFRSELDFEHAFKDPELEFAYLDFLYRPWLNARVGSILTPMGVINQHHEPPLFYSVERPEVYRVIIPTTWQEGGAGIHGKFDSGLDYELYGLSSLNATGFSGNNGFRGGRGRVGSEPARDFAGALRIQYKGFPGLRVGSSAFVGNTGQGNATIGGSLLTMVEGDAKYSLEGIDIEGIVAFTNLSNAGSVNAGINDTLAAGSKLTASKFVAKQMFGWYLEGAYHLFHHLMPQTKHDLVVFARYEDFNTQRKMPSGFAGDPANDRRTITTGISYLPIPQVALKADYMINRNGAGSAKDQFNLGVGFYY